MPGGAVGPTVGGYEPPSSPPSPSGATTTTSTGHSMPLDTPPARVHLASVGNTIDTTRHVHFPSSHKSASSLGGSEASSAGSDFSSEQGVDESVASSRNNDATSSPSTLPSSSSHQPAQKFTSFPRPPPAVNAINSSPSGRRIIASSSSSHVNLAAGLLTPTLASALGISTNGRKRRPSARRQQTSPAPLPPSSLSPWTRRPSLPSLPAREGRMSVCSVASFDSLPEDGVATTLAPRQSPPSSARLSTTHSSCHVAGEASAEAVAAAVSCAHVSGRSRSASSSHLPLAGENGENDCWARRQKVVMELLTTERSFFASLQIINDHYYQPLLALSTNTRLAGGKALSSAAPVLSRKALAEIFSNFSDIMHLNRELLAQLEDRLCGLPGQSDHKSSNSSSSQPLERSARTSAAGACNDANPPWDARSGLVGDLLITIAPFLKMYSFYVKNFSSALTRIEAERKADASFARFLKETEQATWMSHNGRTGGIGFGLGLQAHLLSVVQRIPRYRMLVGELVKSTPSSHRDHRELCRAYQVIEQVATSINDNIRQHELVLQMLGIQRQLIGLPFTLIVPGRSLLKRETLLKGGRKDINAREFFLFTDCIIYAAPIQGTMADASAAAWSALSRYGVADYSTNPVVVSSTPKQPSSPAPVSRRFDEPRRRTTSFPTRMSTYRLSQSLDGQQLQFRDKLSLQDCTVVAVDDAASGESGLRHCIEIHSPGRSFAVYADSQDAKEAWISAIRSAREELQDNRRTLQAEEDSVQAKRDRRRSWLMNPAADSTIPEGPPATSSALLRQRHGSMPSLRASDTPDLAAAANASAAHRAGFSSQSSLKVLEDYNAPVWVPDSRADKCACCSEAFGLWRRKHHCRLCGQVVCWACSTRNFLIASYEEGEQDRPARACDPCYESVFPEAQTSQSQHIDAQRRPESQRPDSEVSVIPSSPSTPTSPSQYCLSPNPSSEHECGHLELGNPEIVESLCSKEVPQDEAGASKQYIAPATRIAKAAAVDAQLLQGRLLSPRVHAATSGGGTFRLVTPRLTTPEEERAPNSQQWPTGGSHTQSGDADGSGGYFAGVAAGQTELSANRGKNAATPFTSPLGPASHEPWQRRKKPLSAAARLSSVYGTVLPSTPSGRRE